MKHIRWEYGVKGILDTRERQLCEEIDVLCSNIIEKGKEISVVISIEGGNQFHVRDSENHNLIGYMSAEQCKYVLWGILVDIMYM